MWGFNNEKDPEWIRLDTLISAPLLSVAESMDSVRILANGDADFDAKKRLTNPYVPTMTFEKFKIYFNLLKEKRFVIMAGVSGTGNTTLIDRIGRTLATDFEKKGANDVAGRLEILCAPQFDLDLHKRYIGEYLPDGSFRKGELLRFWEAARQNPDKNYVAVIENMDKINPETFFGPEIWEYLSDDKRIVTFGNDTLSIPKNFYMFSITHFGVGQKIEMNNEHFKRLGGQEVLPINVEELILFLRDRKKGYLKELAALKKQANADKNALDKLQKNLDTLNDSLQIKRFLYFFEKANALIEEKYSSGHLLGQWSDIRKMYGKNDFEKLQNTFLSHVNALHPNVELKKADFKDIIYTIENDGKMPRTSPFFKAFYWLSDFGLVNEIGIAALSAALAASFGWYYFRQRQKIIQESTTRVYQIMHDFNQNNKDYDTISSELSATKRDFDTLVLSNKVNYNEASFFYGFIEDKMQAVEIARQINESFFRLLDAFLEDGYLSESEFQKLNVFLESIRHKVSAPQYQVYKNEIDRAKDMYGKKKK